MPKYSDYKGKRFGRLTARYRIKGSKWVCTCDCGNEAVIATGHLSNGHTQSCGCYKVQRAKEANTIHGQGSVKSGAITPAYRSWQSMKSRCGNPNADNYEYYGGRGIRVCDRWENSFEEFFNDMGERPKGTTLDRIDSDGDYVPSNCQWSTDIAQKRNRSGVRLFLVNGQSMTAQEAASYMGVDRRTVQRKAEKGLIPYAN